MLSLRQVKIKNRLNYCVMIKKILFPLFILLIFQTAQAQTGISATGAAPDASAMLDVIATDKGMKIPNVALTATNAAGPIASPATSLLVYNTATAGTAPNNVIPGYYYNSGTPGSPVWTRMQNQNLGNFTNIDPIYIRGTGLNNNGNRVVRVGSTEAVNGTGRGLTLTIITKSTHAIVSSTNYDTYGSTAASDNLATALNAMTNAQIGILTSYDAWENAVTTNLKNSFSRLGLFKALMTTVGGSRRPYAAIFEPATGTSVSSASANEVEHYSDANPPFAEQRGWLIDGAFVATNQVPSGLSTPLGVYALGVDESGNVGVGTTSPAAKLEVSGNNIRISNSADAKFEFWGSSSDRGFVGWQAGSGVWLLNKDNTPVFFGTTNTERMRIDAAGNVGIGSTNPLGALDIRVAGSNGAGKIYTGGSNAYPRIYMGGTDPNVAFVINRETTSATMYFGEPGDAGGFQFRGTGSTTIGSLSGSGTRAVVVNAGGTLSTQTITSGTVTSIATGGNGITGGTITSSGTISLDYGSSSTGGPRPVGNFGQFLPHGTTGDFNSVPTHWGWNYVQGNTNAPNTNSGQWYRGVFSLGDAYPARGGGGYSLELAYPRYNHASAGVWMRTIENGSIGGWTRIDANGVTGDNLGNHTATTTLNMNSQSITNTPYYNVLAGNGYGVRFWQSDSYKIHMGNAGEYQYGPVTDYSIKTNMNNQSGRGWTWGVTGATPVAAIEATTGDMQIAGDFRIDGNTVIDDGAGWHRSYGNTGWYNGTYGGGWYMTDATWVRAYNDKAVISGGEIRSGNNMRAPIFYDLDDGNYYTNPNGSSYMNEIKTVGNIYNNAWYRGGTADNGHVRLYGNSRQMVFRTDGTTEYSGQGPYPFVWTYGGDGSGNRRMILNTNGDIWTNSYGWLHSYFAQSSHTHPWSQVTSKPAAWLDAATLIETLGNYNDSRPSGFYQGYNSTNAPTSGTWYNLVNVRHSNTGNDHGFQMAMSYYDDYFYTRTYSGGTGNNDGSFRSWAKHLTNRPGDWELASNSNATGYPNATLELREYNYGGSGVTPPRLSFHWGGVVASQIAIESDGTIAIRNNPGTAYEKFKCLTMRSNGFIEPSDARLKINIAPIGGAMDKIKAMQGVTYNWNKELERNEQLPDKLQYGLIAQELEKIIPELVDTDREGWKGIEYSHLVPVLIEALKEQQAELDEQKKINSGYKSDINSLKKQTQTLEAMIMDIVSEKKATGNK